LKVPLNLQQARHDLLLCACVFKVCFSIGYVEFLTIKIVQTTDRFSLRYNMCLSGGIIKESSSKHCSIALEEVSPHVCVMLNSKDFFVSAGLKSPHFQWMQFVETLCRSY